MVFQITAKLASSDPSLNQSHVGRWAVGCSKGSISPVVMMQDAGEAEAITLEFMLGMMDAAKEFKAK